MTKKFLALFLVICIFACMAVACGNNDNTEPTTAPTVAPTQNTTAAPTQEPTVLPATTAPTTEPTVAPTDGPDLPTPDEPLYLWLKDVVKVRPQPSTSGDELALYAAGKKIEVVGYIYGKDINSEYDWYVIGYDGSANGLAYLAVMDGFYTEDDPSMPSRDNPKLLWIKSTMKVRPKPSTAGSELTMYHPGTEIEAIGYIKGKDINSEYDWYVIEYAGGIDGLAYLAALTGNYYTETNPNPPSESKPWYLKLKGEMNIRDAADGNRITSLPAGTVVTVVDIIAKADTPNKSYDYLAFVYEDGIAYMAYLPENFTFVRLK